MVIVNVASECGLTQTNYVQLKELLDKYKSQGLAIAAFPSNQFGIFLNSLCLKLIMFRWARTDKQCRDQEVRAHKVQF